MAHNQTLPNMATITSSIESSLENGSLNHLQISSSDSNSSVSVGGSGGAESGYGGSESPKTHHLSKTIELNSEIPLPEYWEQFLDLQTGEMYYKNWNTGIKVTEDPRTTAAYCGNLYSEDDSGSYDSDGSSSESCASSSTERWSHNGDLFMQEFNVLVAAGCKSCLLYYMVPKQRKDCPRCHSRLLRF